MCRRAELEVHHHRGAGLGVCAGDGVENGPLEGGDGPVVDAGLEHPGAHRLAVGAGRAIARPVVARGIPVDQVGENSAVEGGGVEVAQPGLRGVVGVPVGAGGRHDREPGGAADPRHRLRVAAEPDRRGVDHRCRTRSRRSAAASACDAALVGQLVAGQQRRDLEEVLVVVHPAEVAGGHVAEHRADEGRDSSRVCRRVGEALDEVVGEGQREDLGDHLGPAVDEVAPAVDDDEVGGRTPARGPGRGTPGFRGS